jgi:2-oxoglutarate dehydrogenase E2 component (dihydrolipoamide succinyltransferase)
MILNYSTMNQNYSLIINYYNYYNMSLEIKVPPVGESITEVTLSAGKKRRRPCRNGRSIAELESDKATFELTAEKAGTLKTAAAEGDVLAIGAVVANY